jgi:1,4-alpha-glucan branching enzyme
MPTWRLDVANQNHDQIGNRAVGNRITVALDDDQLACAALLTLAGPFTLMLFQGEESAMATPFQFFTSHPAPELARATAEGRLAETRLFTMRRSALLVVVNFSTSLAAPPVEETEILFETESGVDLSDGVLSLPGRAGALLR